MTRQQHKPSPPVRIPANVEREDPILAGLTARQVIILTSTAAVLYGSWLALRDQVAVEVFAVAMLPIVGLAVTIALGRRDGLGLDRWLAAAFVQRLRRRRFVHAPEGVPDIPEWITDGITATSSARRRDLTGAQPSTDGSGLPAARVADAGVVELEEDGLAVVASVAPVNFALRSPAEQEMLVATFARYLHAITSPIQILIRTTPVDLTTRIKRLRSGSDRLPFALGDAAREHADFLTQLGTGTRLWNRQMLMILRNSHTSNKDGADRHAAETRLLGQLDEAAALLSPAGISLTPLDTEQATALLATASSPATQIPATHRMSSPDEVITVPTGATTGGGPA